MKPTFRFATKKALDELADELHLRERIPIWDLVAGQSYTPANAEDLDQYISHYATLEEDDKKFALMEMMIQAIVDQPTEAKLRAYWQQVKPILVKEYSIHEYTIYYWKDMTTAEFEYCKFLSPLLREIWKGDSSNP